MEFVYKILKKDISCINWYFQIYYHIHCAIYK